MRLTENLGDCSIMDDNDVSEPQRTALIGLKGHGKKAAVSHNRTGNAVKGRLTKSILDCGSVNFV